VRCYKCVPPAKIMTFCFFRRNTNRALWQQADILYRQNRTIKRSIHGNGTVHLNCRFRFFLVGFFMFSIMEPLGIIQARVAGFIHLLFIYLAYAIKESTLMMWWNFVMGVGLFAITYMFDIRRNLMRPFLRRQN